MSDVRLVTLAGLVGDLKADAEAAWQAKQSGRPRGPVTGLPEIDDALGGCLCPGLHVVQAAPGAGKTAFALQAAYPFSSHDGSIVLMPKIPIPHMSPVKKNQTYLPRHIR